MAFTLDRMIKIRPYVYHLTARRNVSRIRRTGKLHSAAVALAEADQKQWIRTRRKDSLVVNIGDEALHIRDQAPLHEGSMALEGGFSFEDFVEYVNGFVFFWPGKDDKPIEAGVNHFKRYKIEGPAILRVSVPELTRSGKALPLFGKYNSGAPRCNKGRKIPRGPRTFIECSEAPFPAGEVTEVVYRSVVELPKTTKVGYSFDSPWKNLFAPL